MSVVQSVDLSAGKRISTFDLVCSISTQSKEGGLSVLHLELASIKEDLVLFVVRGLSRSSQYDWHVRTDEAVKA